MSKGTRTNLKLTFVAFVVPSIGVGGLFAGVVATPKAQPAWNIVIAGDVMGYLSPCGCTTPMTGGIRRWATGVRALGDSSRTIVLVNGGLVPDVRTQDIYKSEALAEALGTFPKCAVNLTGNEARLGVGGLSSVDRLSNGALVSTVLSPSPEISAARFKTLGPLLVGGAVEHPETLSSLGTSVEDDRMAADLLVREADARKKMAVLMLRGDQTEATSLAKRFPGLAMIVYSTSGNPRQSIEGKTWLVSPGEQGKYLVRATLVGDRFSGYSSVSLGPQFANDPLVAKIYSGYLRRVDRSNLLEGVPRTSASNFSGSQKCGSCHQKAFDIWEKSKHFGSLKTLQSDGHGRDPECVGCHVTGLSDENGYRSPTLTPNLAFVGCESCHGAGADHSASPNTVKMAPIGEKVCISCHSIDNSPNFNFLTYMRRVAH